MFFLHETERHLIVLPSNFLELAIHQSERINVYLQFAGYFHFDLGITTAEAGLYGNYLRVPFDFVSKFEIRVRGVGSPG
jgi:hypothetical protein